MTAGRARPVSVSDTVRVLFFGSLGERLGAERLVALAAPCTLATLRSRLAEHAAGLDAPTIRASIDQVLAGPEAVVRAGQEIAFFPPFSGG